MADRKADHLSADAVIAKEENEGVRLAVAEDTNKWVVLCDVRRGLENASFRDHDNSLPDIILRCDAKNIGTYATMTDIVFMRLDKKKDRAPRWRWIVDGFASDSRASKDANGRMILSCFVKFVA